LYPFILCVVYDTLHTACIPACIRHPIRSTSSVESYLRSYLTADSRTSLVPAIFHFYFHFYYFIILMFERFMNCIVPFHMVCLLRYTASSTKSLEHLYYILLFYSSSCIHPAFILHSSCIHPVCILSTSCIHPVCILSTSRHSSGTQSFLSSSVLSYLRYYLTADSRTSPVPAIFHFFILFYYFIISMFERFMICIVSFHFVCLL
jgi:hypothetical protein